jgi:hypothetical protein
MQNDNYELARRVQRDDGVTLIAIYHFIVALFFLLGTMALALPTLILAIVAVTGAPPAAIGMFAVGLGATVTMIFCILYLSVGYGLWTVRQWARIAAMALAAPALLFFPIGTGIGALILWHLAKSNVAHEFEYRS